MYGSTLTEAQEVSGFLAWSNFSARIHGESIKNSTFEYISFTCILETMTEKQRQKEVFLPSQQQVPTIYSWFLTCVWGNLLLRQTSPFNPSPAFLLPRRNFHCVLPLPELFPGIWKFKWSHAMRGIFFFHPILNKHILCLVYNVHFGWSSSFLSPP